MNYPTPTEDTKKAVPCLQEAERPRSDTWLVLTLSWILNASVLRQHQRIQAWTGGVPYLSSRGDLTGWAPLQSSYWLCQGLCFLHEYYLKGEPVVSVLHSVTAKGIGHEHKAHVIVLISKMGVSYRNTKFGDMENVTVLPQEGSFRILFSWN